MLHFIFFLLNFLTNYFLGAAVHALDRNDVHAPDLHHAVLAHVDVPVHVLYVEEMTAFPVLHPHEGVHDHEALHTAEVYHVHHEIKNYAKRTTNCGWGMILNKTIFWENLYMHF